MTKRFLSPISLANLSTDPTGSTGAFYYNTASNALKYYNGSTWVTLGAVTSFSAGTTGLTPSTGTTGAITLAGTLLVANGGTGTATAGITAFNNITGYTATGATGTTSTNLVFSTSPTLTTPTLTSPIHSAGTTTAAPIRFTTTGASLLTTPAAGNMEVDSSGNLYYSPSTTRYIIPLSTTGNSLVFTTTGNTTITLPTSGTMITSSSPTITTPVIDSISASATNATNSLWSTNSTGTISIGSGLTTGTLNIATGTGSTNINIGHTGAIFGLTGSFTMTGNVTGTGSFDTIQATTSLFSTPGNISFGSGATQGYVFGTTSSLILNIVAGAGTNNKTIGIGTSSTGGTTAITIGSSSGATSTVTLNGTVNTTSGSFKVGNTTLAQGVTGTITFPATAGTLMLNPMTTAGDIIYGGASGAPTRLAGSATNNYVLTYNTGTTAPVWASVTAIPYTPSTLISSNITLVAFNSYFIDTTAARTLTLPAAATLGDEIHIFDVSGSAATNNITVANNGLNIRGSAQTLVINVNYAAVVLVYLGATYGWRVS